MTGVCVLLVVGALVIGHPAMTLGDGGVVWNTDYESALAEAGSRGRPLLLEFTGSDWCDWCRALRGEVFETAEFAAWAADRVVLVEVDFPKGTPQEERVRRQNRALADRFAEKLRDGYPTILFLDPGGSRIIGDLGYLDGGPAVWAATAERLLSGGR